MISLEYKFLFIHVPKTGGNSIQNVLSAYSEDTLIRFENLNDDFNRVCRKIGLPDVPALPVRNSSDRKPYACYYDDELRDMVKKKFRNEIEYGDYEFKNNL